MAQGIRIVGKNPEANLLAHISRDQRFARVSRGMYTLNGRPTK